MNSWYRNVAHALVHAVSRLSRHVFLAKQSRDRQGAFAPQTTAPRTHLARPHPPLYPQSMFCTQCGVELEPQDRYCYQCGKGTGAGSPWPKTTRPLTLSREDKKIAGVCA